MMIIQPCPGCAATNQVQVERIAALEARIAELDVLNNNQRSMLEGKHEYVGQDFKFRMDTQAKRSAKLEALLKDVVTSWHNVEENWERYQALIDRIESATPK